MAPSQRNKAPAGIQARRLRQGLVNIGMSLVRLRLIPIQASRLTFWLLIMNLMKSHSMKTMMIVTYRLRFKNEERVRILRPQMIF